MQCEKIYLPVLKAGGKMSKSEVYRILNLQSFEEETQLPRQNGVRDLERAIMPVGTPNNRRIHDCDGSNGQR